MFTTWICTVSGNVLVFHLASRVELGDINHLLDRQPGQAVKQSRPSCRRLRPGQGVRYGGPRRSRHLNLEHRPRLHAFGHSHGKALAVRLDCDTAARHTQEQDGAYGCFRTTFSPLSGTRVRGALHLHDLCDWRGHDGSNRDSIYGWELGDRSGRRSIERRLRSWVKPSATPFKQQPPSTTTHRAHALVPEVNGANASRYGKAKREDNIEECSNNRSYRATIIVETFSVLVYTAQRLCDIRAHPAVESTFPIRRGTLASHHAAVHKPVAMVLVDHGANLPWVAGSVAVRYRISGAITDIIPRVERG
jgi:hypothetical protein